MIKKIVVISALALVFIIGGCGTSEVDIGVEASVPEGYETVSESSYFKDHIHLIEVRHIESGCHATFTLNTYDYDASVPEPIYVKENGVTVPYCTY